MISHEDLTNPIYVPLCPLRQITGSHVVDVMSSVLNSYQHIPFNTTFSLQIATFQLPTGRGFDTTIEEWLPRLA